MDYKPKTKIKSIQNIITEYKKQSANIGAKISEFEALKPFFGKKGNLLARSFRSKRQQAKFEEAVKAFRQSFGRGNKKNMVQDLQEQKKKDEKRLKKARKTYIERQKKKAGADFKRIARKAGKEYSRMLQLFTDQSIVELTKSYGFGSPVLQFIAEKNLSSEDAKKFIILLGSQSIADIPTEAQALASQDDFYNVTLSLLQMGVDEQKEFSEIYLSYIDEMSQGTGGQFLEIVKEYKDSGTEKPFGEVWEEMQNTSDPYNLDTLYEVLDDDNS